MASENKLYQAYLEEMQHIEKFRTSHISMYGEAPVDTDDPYTKRLIESLAFFGARARLQGTEKIVQIHQRLFRQYFPYLINPLPAFGMLQMKPSIRFPEKVVLPIGSELIFKTKNNLKAVFQTLDEITIFPFSIKSFDFVRRGGDGWQFIMEFVSTHINTEEIGNFRLYINHLNSFLSSLSISFALQYALERVHVFYDDEKEKNAKGKDCTIEYGYNSQQRIVFCHVIEQLRSLLHFPQQELFINLQIPPSGKRWKSFTLIFDLNDKWPEFLKLNGESFIPYVVPIINLKKAYAEPILDNGTKDSYPLLHPEPIHKFELHTVLNVSEVLSIGTKPIAPGFLGVQGEGSFEVDYFKNEMILNLPNAFQHPKTVMTEGLWMQSWFSNYINDELDLIFTDVQTLGIQVRLLGSIHRFEKTLDDDPDFLIRLLSLKNQNRLTTNEIIFILNTMKNLNNTYFDSIPHLIKELKINERFNQQQMNSLIEYEFFLKDLEGQRWELVILFFKYVNDLLNCWLSSFEVETKVHFTRNKKPTIFKRGTKNELSILARDFLFS